ncbi:M48 family metalloprotease [Peribacillus sp. JNUCC41]|uniref:M48 family metalloprotease n=1 Tax=Peribacillus sp. JNUCC41 TaxID=2778370 RepID=UPI00177B13D0|nr:M48 family metalloprotease [Brevibacillus sp. JNUCC-41]QOS89022.1 M48 family metalloprotease [Brevibacillus sp. JNUCC-41]
MYVFDFFKRLFRKEKVGVILYLLLNIGLLYIVFSQNDSPVRTIVTVIVLYFLSLCIALSPIGESILRFQTGAKKIKRKDLRDKLEPLFNEVYEKARLKDPSLPNDVRLYIANDISENAFAVGRKTICLFKGLLSLPEEEIQAIIAHEFGHLSHKDTDINLVVYVGNIFINVIMFFVRIVLTIFLFIFEFPLRLLLGMFEDKTPRIERTITYGDADEKRPRFTWSGAIVDFLWSLWTWLGVLFIRSSTRQSEYHADLFAYELGYGEELASALDRIQVYIPEQGFLKAMYATHPSMDDRIAKLQELGSEYTDYSL